MNKKSMTLLSAAALIATVAAGNQVHAEDTTTPTTPVTNEASATETKITESEVAEAKEEVTQAQNKVADAKEQVNEAKKTLNTANQEVSDTQEAIQSGEQASQIVSEQDKVIVEKTAEKETLDAQLSDAQEVQTKAQSQVDNAVNQQTQAQTQVDTAKSQADMKQQAFDDAQAKESQAVEKVAETEKALQQETQKVSQTTADIEKVDTKITETQKALNTPQNVEKKVVYQKGGYKQEADEDAEHKNMEKVDFQGSRTVEIEVSPEQYAKYLETGYTDYNLDNKELAQAFVKMLNELRALNGLSSDFEVDKEFQAYSEARAKEMLANNKLSHDTELERMPNSQENAGARYGAKNQPKFISAEQFAYEQLLGWYSDYNNVYGRNYGHRRSLLTPTGGKMGFATAYRLNGHDLTGYDAYNALDNKAKFHLEHDDLGDMYVCDTPEDEAIFEESIAVSNSWDESDKLNPTFLGRHMVFLPDFKFVYYANVPVEDNRDALRQELATLNQQKVALIANKANAEQETQRLTQLLDTLTQAETNAKQAKATAEKELSQAKGALAQASQALDVATANAKQKADALATVTQKVNALTRQANQLANEIVNAQELKEAALRHKQDLTALKATLEEAKTKQAQAKVAKDEADQKLAVVQDKLVQVTNAYTQLKNRYDLQTRIDEALQPKDTENQSDDGTQIDDNQKDDTDNQNNAHVPNDEVKVDDNTSNNGTNNVGLIQTVVKTNKNIETLNNKELGVTDNALQETTGLSRVAARKAKENLPKAGFKENSVALFGFALFLITGGLSVKRSFRNE